MKTDNEIIADFMGYYVFEHDSFGTLVRCYSKVKDHSVESYIDTTKPYFNYKKHIETCAKNRKKRKKK